MSAFHQNKLAIKIKANQMDRVFADIDANRHQGINCFLRPATSPYLQVKQSNYTLLCSGEAAGTSHSLTLKLAIRAAMQLHRTGHSCIVQQFRLSICRLSQVNEPAARTMYVCAVRKSGAGPEIR
nr:hypothetical protein [uncultured Cohaesibacter sp.]